MCPVSCLSSVFGGFFCNREDNGESQSHQHRHGRHQRVYQVKGHGGGRGPQRSAARLHRELPQHPIPSAAEERNLRQREEQREGNPHWPQVSSMFLLDQKFGLLLDYGPLFPPLFPLLPDGTKHIWHFPWKKKREKRIISHKFLHHFSCIRVN